jgi:hypothetical protein
MNVFLNQQQQRQGKNQQKKATKPPPCLPPFATWNTSKTKSLCNIVSILKKNHDRMLMLQQ